MDISKDILAMLSSHVDEGELQFIYNKAPVDQSLVFKPEGLLGLYIDKITPRFNYVYNHKIVTKTTLDRQSLLKKQVLLNDKPHICFLVVFVIYHELLAFINGNIIDLDRYFN
ncbi:hypothetical protein [Facilibium subflavum]|uniref:hypothetical protein n=1 Tax=Facilibium subflavum TaxID=2219058 RepID=UPI000E656676|nr:hypothetical protein [Facilibium subflavum]